MKRALTILLALSLGIAAFGEDSPMVAAAKRANRKGKKPANVITNETLSKAGSGAHITTAATQKPFVAPKPYVPPRPTPDMIAQQQRDAAKRKAETEAAARVKAEASRNESREAAASASEEALFDDDEAEAAQTGTAVQKPPQR
ncbi:MAG TPA: hypothetical protein VM733_17515 [Thermoanaerobaculia bacterium]|nr:hypothetical protein [Thermoanaerobaculia bacterium]